MGKALFAAIVIAILISGSQDAAATAPRDITIEHHATPVSGTFTATGAITDSGDVTRDAAHFSGIPSPVVGTGQFVYTFRGSAGSLTVRLQWLLTATDVPWLGHIDGRWVVIDGTGAYAGLHGQGDYTATIDFQLMKRDAVFSGQVH